MASWPRTVKQKRKMRDGDDSDSNSDSEDECYDPIKRDKILGKQPRRLRPPSSSEEVIIAVMRYRILQEESLTESEWRLISKSLEHLLTYTARQSINYEDPSIVRFCEEGIRHLELYQHSDDDMFMEEYCRCIIQSPTLNDAHQLFSNFMYAVRANSDRRPKCIQLLLSRCSLMAMEMVWAGYIDVVVDVASCAINYSQQQWKHRYGYFNNWDVDIRDLDELIENTETKEQYLYNESQVNYSPTNPSTSKVQPPSSYWDSVGYP